jgi:hypothetical protein
MTQTNSTPSDPKPKGFPFVTVIATLITLFAFLGLTVLAYRSPNYLGETKTEPKIDPATRLEDVREKNQAVLDGKSGGKISVSEATDRLLLKLKSEKDKLPFPTPEPPVSEPKGKK